MCMCLEWYVKLYLRSRATNRLGKKARSRRAVASETAFNSDETLSYSTDSRNDFLEVSTAFRLVTEPGKYLSDSYSRQ